MEEKTINFSIFRNTLKVCIRMFEAVLMYTYV